MLRLKLDLKDNFGHKNGWGISFTNRLESKTSGIEGFWREIERGKNQFLEREWFLDCRKNKEEEEIIGVSRNRLTDFR